MNQTPYQTPNTDTSWDQLRETVKEQAELIRALQAQQTSKACQCHIIDPSKMRILLWINRHKNGKPDTCILKIAEQRLLGLPRSDRRGEVYWRFDEILEKKDENAVSNQKIPIQTSFKCSECQAQVEVIGSDNPADEIKQREALKKELAREEKSESVSQENKTPRQALKEQMEKAIQENQQAEKLKQNETINNPS